MRSPRTLVALLAALALATGAFAQSKGRLRITGRVVDGAGQPVADAQVRAAKRTEAQPEIFTAKTNEKGEFRIDGVAAGDWVLEGAKEGVGTKEVSATVAEGQPTNVEIVIAPAAPAAPDPNVEIQQRHQEALQLWQQGKPAEARAIYEGLLQKYPTVHQLRVPLASIYAEEKNYQRAIEELKLAREKDPENVDWKILHADLLLETKDVAAAQTILETVDVTKARDARVFTNLAINQINEKRAEPAIELLTKLMAQFPEDHGLLYYRARGYIAANKFAEARADLEKFVATAPPDAPQMADAKNLIAQLDKQKK